jgi:hypothetical protein
MRLYVENGRPVLSFGSSKPWRQPKRIHLHHFIWGFLLTPISWVLFIVGHDNLALAVGGVASALWFSEAKEIIKQKWGP